MDEEEIELEEMGKMAENIMDALTSDSDEGLNLIVLIGAIGKIFQFMHSEYPQVREPMKRMLRILVEDFERVEELEMQSGLKIVVDNSKEVH